MPTEHVVDAIPLGASEPIQTASFHASSDVSQARNVAYQSVGAQSPMEGTNKSSQTDSVEISNDLSENGGPTAVGHHHPANSICFASPHPRKFVFWVLSVIARLGALDCVVTRIHSTYHEQIVQTEAIYHDQIVQTELGDVTRAEKANQTDTETGSIESHTAASKPSLRDRILFTTPGSLLLWGTLFAFAAWALLGGAGLGEQDLHHSHPVLEGFGETGWSLHYIMGERSRRLWYGYWERKELESSAGHRIWWPLRDIRFAVGHIQSRYQISLEPGIDLTTRIPNEKGGEGLADGGESFPHDMCPWPERYTTGGEMGEAEDDEEEE